jgi:hypothetical protein
MMGKNMTTSCPGSKGRRKMEGLLLHYLPITGIDADDREEVCFGRLFSS